MGGMLMNGGAGGLSQGLQQGMGMGMQYRQMQGDKEDRELQKELRDYQMKEQKLRLDQMKLQMDKDKKLEHAEQVFLEKFGRYPDGGSLPVQGPPPPAQGQSAQWPPPDVQQPPQDIMQLMKLAMAAGKVPELAAGMQAGIVETPKNQMELAAKMAELQQKAVEMKRDTVRFEREGNEEKRAEAGEAREDTRLGMERERLGLSKAELSQNQKKFELDYNKAQMAMKEEKYRQELGLKFLSEGTPESIAAGQAVLGGDFAGGLKLRYPSAAGLTDNQIIAGVQRGDKVFAEMLQIKRDMKERTGIEVTYGKDGTMTTRVGDLSSQPSIYPTKAFQEDAVAMADIDLAVGSLNELGEIIKADPMAVGPVGATTQTLDNLKAWAARLTGQEVKLSKTATAAQQIKTLELETTRKMVKSLGSNPSNMDVKFIQEMIGGSGGVFSTSTAEQKLIALDALKAMMAREKASVAGRQQHFQENAPKKPARKTLLDKKMESILGTPEAAPDPSVIQQQIESMAPEQKQQRMQELLQKQGG